MATSSAFTTSDRRKRIATYGKASRPKPNLDWNDDAPSPERPRKLAGPVDGILKSPGPAFAAKSALGGRAHGRKSSVTQDVFDVPSDDDERPLPSPVPTPRSLPKPKVTADDFDVPSSGDDLTAPKRRIGKIHQSRKHVKQQRETVSTDARSEEDSLAPPRRRAKTPQLLHGLQNTSAIGGMQAAKRPVVKPKNTSKTVTPATPAVGIKPRSTKQKACKTSELLVRKVTEKTAESDIFDVPLSDEDVPPQSSRKPRAPILSHDKSPRPSKSDPLQGSGSPTASDDSDSSRKRKRQPQSQFSATMKEHCLREKHRGNLGEKKPQRGASVTSAPTTLARSVKDVAVVIPSINKPKRTRTRTAPGPTRPPISKGQSSPAKLHSMLAVRPLNKPASISKEQDISFEDDETMYDIPEPEIPVAQSARPSATGSVTPRQRQLFSSLLDDSSNATTPGMPSIARLQLSDRRPNSLVSGLLRSSSDIPRTSYSRKPKLIDTLMQTAPSFEGEGDESESEEEVEKDIIEIPAISMPTTKKTQPTSGISIEEDTGMDIDPASQTNSQASQSTLILNGGTKVTYANKRTYREETGLGEDLLLTADIGDLLGLDDFGTSKGPKAPSDEEDDPASQVRGIHELRMQGQTQKFQMEAQTAIDDISGKAGLGASVRRSVMLEFCTRMADEKFIHQLLESALGHQFLKSIASRGEIVFDFAATVAIAFILETGPGFTTLEQIHQPSTMATLLRLLDMNADVNLISRQRKTNLSGIAREDVDKFRTLVQESRIWNLGKPEKLSPQIVAIRALDYLMLGLRKSGNTDALLGEKEIRKLLDMAAGPSQRWKAGKGTSQDMMILHFTFSILEAVSMSNERQAAWSDDMMARLMDMMPVVFDAGSSSPIKLAIRLCMNLTNNRPRSCEVFAGPAFVEPLVRSICHKFALLSGEVVEDEREEVMEVLILSLGAMINLAEFSDQARSSIVANGDELLDEVAKIFLEGSERAAQADSMEESQSSVTVGYLTVLLGNLCLNDVVRSKVRAQLPGQRMDMLLEQIREFVRYNERVDKMTDQFEGEAGRETWHNFTRRLMLVVGKLEQAEQ